MRKFTVNLMNAINEGRDKIVVGNHKMERRGNKIALFYHNNMIMLINEEDDTIVVDDCGYATSSTTQAINSHIEGIREILYINHKHMEKVDLSYNQRFIRKMQMLLS